MGQRSHVDAVLFVEFIDVGPEGVDDCESLLADIQALGEGESLVPILQRLPTHSDGVLFHERYHSWQEARLPFLFLYATCIEGGHERGRRYTWGSASGTSRDNDSSGNPTTSRMSVGGVGPGVDGAPWDCEESHAASLGLTAVLSAIREGRPMIGGFSQRTHTRPIGGHGLA